MTIQQIQEAVAARFRLTVADLKGTSRAWSIARPRMIAMYLVRRLLGTSYTEIGQRFGDKDHTTALNACRRIKLGSVPGIQTAVAELLAQLGQAGVAAEHELGGRLLGLRHVLRHLRHAPLARDDEVTAVLVQAAVEQGKQRGFARAVAAHQTHFFAWVQVD